jgi:hypothetical protein
MIAAFDWTTVIPTIMSFVFGGGIVALVTAIFKVRPEAGQIVVTAAQGALLVQTGVIDNLKKEISRLNDELVEVKKMLSDRDKQILQLQTQLLTVRDNQDRHEKEIKQHVSDSVK